MPIMRPPVADRKITIAREASKVQARTVTETGVEFWVENNATTNIIHTIIMTKRIFSSSPDCETGLLCLVVLFYRLAQPVKDIGQGGYYPVPG